jgi:CRP-like cAMP-binding protein
VQLSAVREHSLAAWRFSRTAMRRWPEIPEVLLQATQERIAGMLGVRCEGVTTAALKLQREGLIRYGRGCISFCQPTRSKSIKESS